MILLIGVYMQVLSSGWESLIFSQNGSIASSNNGMLPVEEMLVTILVRKAEGQASSQVYSPLSI